METLQAVIFGGFNLYRRFLWRLQRLCRALWETLQTRELVPIPSITIPPNH